MTEARDLGDARQEFLERQRTGLGATDSPKILGLSRWGTPLTVYRDKVDPVAEDESSLPAWLGMKLQGTVAELYTAREGVRLRADNKHHRSRSYDFIVCHLDFRAWGRPDLLVECKTKAYMTGWGPDGSAEIPADVWVQVQHEMYVTGATECHVAVLFGHHTFRVYPIKRDDQFLDKLVSRLIRFWNDHVEPRIPPLPIGHYLDDGIIRRDHPAGDGTLKPATPEQAKLANQLKAVRVNAAQIKTAQEELENRLKQIIGDADGLTGPFGTITFKRSKDSESVDWEQVAVAYGNVVEDLLLLANPGDDPETVARLARAQAVYETAVGLATVTTPGSRRFIVKFTEEAG